MLNVHHGIAVANRATVDAEGLKPVSKVCVLEAISEPFVEAAHRPHVLGPGRRIPAPPARLAWDPAVHQVPDSRQMTDQEPASLVDAGPPETGPVQLAGGNVFRGDALRQSTVQVHRAAREIAVAPRGLHVDVKTMPAGDTVSVEEDQVVA